MKKRILNAMFVSQDKKAAQDTEREARIREQEIENLTSSRHLEAVQIKSLLAQRGLQIHEVFRRSKKYEPPRGKTNNVVSEQVRHKPTCTSTEKSQKLEISDLSRRGIVLSE